MRKKMILIQSIMHNVLQVYNAHRPSESKSVLLIEGLVLGAASPGNLLQISGPSSYLLTDPRLWVLKRTWEALI